MATQISQLASHTAYLRAIAFVELYGETQTGDWLAHHFVPPDWAESLHTPEARDYVKANVMHPGMYAYLTARTAHMDAVFTQAVADGMRQVVILGAGFDTRALRLLPEDSACRVFELDTAATQAHKMACLEKIPDVSTRAVRYAAADLRESDLAYVLSETGADREARTLFLLEGLTMYLPCDAVNALLGAIHAWAANASRLVMDYLLEDVLAGETKRHGAAGLPARAESHGEPFQCGYSNNGVEALAKGFGYGVRHHLKGDDLTARFLRESDLAMTGPINECFPNIVLTVER